MLSRTWTIPRRSLAPRILVAIFLTFLLASDAIAQNFRINAETGASLPIGSFADTYGLGPVARLGAEVFVIDRLSAIASAGYIRWPILSSAGNDLLRAASLPGTLEIDGGLRNIPIEFGLRYYSFGPDFDWYFGILTAWYQMRGTADLRFTPTSGPVVTTSVAEDWSSGGYELRLGASMPLDADWRVHAVVAYVEIADWDHELVPPTLGGPSNPEIPSVRSITFTLGFSYGSPF